MKEPDGYNTKGIQAMIENTDRNPATYGVEIHCISDSKGGVRFFYRQQKEKYIALKGPEAKKVLRMAGVPDEDGLSGMKIVDEMLTDLQMNQSLDYAGYIAGYDAGLHDNQGARILSMRSPKTPELSAGSFGLLDSVLDSIFYDDANRERFEAWAYWTWKYLHERRWAPLPALALAGPKNCGKTLAAYLMIHILGDTTPGKAMRFLRGDTSFNADLVASHVLLADDEISDTDMRTRKAIGQQIKSIAVTTAHRIESKGVDSITLSPHWRLIICTNDEPEHLQVLPPIDEGMIDKILLLRCKKAVFPMPTATPEERRVFMTALQSEAPGWLYALSKRANIVDFGDSRQMVTGWQDDSLLDAMGNMSSEAALLEILDMLKPWQSQNYIEVTASELESTLTAFDSPVKNKASKLLSWNNACGSLLGHLSKRYPERVQKIRSVTARKWRICAPNYAQNQMEIQEDYAATY
jgi:DNA polymerase III delta prime subunit